MTNDPKQEATKVMVAEQLQDLEEAADKRNNLPKHQVVVEF